MVRALTFLVAVAAMLYSLFFSYLMMLFIGWWMAIPALAMLQAWYVAIRLAKIQAPMPLLLWSLAYFSAVSLALLLVIEQWPMDRGGYDAHGFGASGGEINFALLPLWLMPTMYFLQRRFRRNQSTNP